MFERFTKDARAVVVEAQTVAREAHAPSIRSAHLLLSIGRLDAGPAARALAELGVGATALADAATGTRAADELDAEALAALGIDLAAVSARADEVFGPDALGRAGDARRPAPTEGGRIRHIPFTRDAKKVLEVALREAIRLGDRSINSEHILRAIVRVDDAASRLLLTRTLAAVGSDVPGLLAVLDRARRGEGPAGSLSRVS